MNPEYMTRLIDETGLSHRNIDVPIALAPRGFERRMNPLLLLGRDDFIAAFVTTTPPRPEGMERLLAANLGRLTYA